MTYLGVEWGCKYVLTGPDGTRAVFNDSTDVDFVGVLNPEESSGLDAPEIREDSAERVEDDGAIFGDFFSGKRPVVFGGEITFTDPVDRNEKVGKLSRASNAKTGNAVLTWEPLGAGQQVQVELRRQQPLRVTGGYAKKFQLAMVSADSKIVSSALHTATASGLKVGTLANQTPTAVATEEFQVFKNRDYTPWATPENAKAIDGTSTTTTPGEAVFRNIGERSAGTDFLVGTWSLASLPSGAWITNITVEITAKIAEVPPVSSIKQFNRILSTGVASDAFQTVGVLTTSLASASTAMDPLSMLEITGRGAMTAALKTSFKYAFAWEFVKPPLETFTVKQVSVDGMKMQISYVVAVTVSATNNGDVPADSIFKVVGPLTNPTIENQTNGEQMFYGGVIVKGETVTFNTAARTAVSSKYGNVFNNIQFPTNWIKIKPGANVIGLIGESGSETETKLELEWHDAWE